MAVLRAACSAKFSNCMAIETCYFHLLISFFSYHFLTAPPLTFTEIPDEDLLKSVVEQEELVLSCEVSVLDGAVQWYKDGSEIQPSDTITVQADGAKRSLIISLTKLSDMGTYSCRAGDNVLMFKVNVRGNSMISVNLLYKSTLFKLLLNLYSSNTSINISAKAQRQKMSPH